ncbi:hypothetical protein M408DRAFT_104318 [Serendipita vermifera MAFF 305830]|uniref:F-box domain-containing protein n=1 Tax=Serendipita vermifera MAFF 305830 TaxID=933852 RepID=A0A0C2WVG1_SERVB|nr:hypothetical protein M408DRAFT_104318 [Serendipita vermifera MAFF 305830]
MGKEVFLFIARTISTPEKLTIAFMDQCSFQKLSWTVTSTVNKELTLKNCGPMKIFRRSDTKWAASLIKLKIINSTTERLMWPLFREWIILQVSQMKHLELVTTFSNPQPDDSIEPTSFKSLDSIRTRLGTLIILYRSLLYTPVLRSLTVISSEHVDLEAWKTFVIDSQGGGSITKVTIENDKDANWVSLSTYLRQIPKLQTLEIMGDAVRPLLHSLIEFSESEETSKAERLLKKLTVLSIVDYQDEGEEIFAFASKYLPVHGNISNGDERPGSILRVSLRNCPNISGHIMQMMEEAGLVLDFNSPLPNIPCRDRLKPLGSNRQLNCWEK